MSSVSSKLSAGLADLAEGHFKKVHAEALEMIRLDVSDPIAYCLLGHMAAAHGNHFKALELHQRACQHSSSQAVYYVFYAQQLTQVGQQELAKKMADQAATSEIDDAHLADTLGVVYSRTGYHEKAIGFFKKAVRLNSEPANFHYNLGASLQFLGLFDEAEAAYKATIDRDANSYKAWSSLVALKRQSKNENHLDDLERLFEHFKGDADAALHLGHALAKTYEDQGEYRHSFEWLNKAKHLKKSASTAASLSYNHIFEAAKSTAPSETANQILKSMSENNHGPIFIVGLPRTGTTLVDRIISSHSSVVAAGELNLFPGLVKQACQTPSNMVMDAQTLIAANQLDLSKVGEAYRTASKELARGAARFTDKMPLNFFYAGLIHRALPNARIIALRRSSMDSCLSNYRQLLTVQFSYYNYTYDLKATADFYRGYHDLVEHWRRHISEDCFMEVRYEDIVTEQELQTRRLLDFCGLAWEDACMRFHENEAPVSTASSVQVRQPLYSGSIGRWRRYGDKLDVLKEALGDLAD